MVILGLTGGIGSGKSTVASILKDLGAEIIDLDEVARLVVLPGEPAYEAVVDHFGREILKPDGQIDRARLGQVVFGNPGLLQQLNEITHPAIRRKVDEIMEHKRQEERRSGRERVVVMDVPLLFEVGTRAGMDEVWVVTASTETRIRRLKARGGITREEALRRIESQMPLDEKARLADVVIYNDGSLEETRNQVQRAWRKLCASRGLPTDAPQA